MRGRRLISILFVAIVASSAMAQQQPSRPPGDYVFIEPPPLPVIFFDWNSARIGPAAAATLDQAAMIFRTNGLTGIGIAAHTDSSGSAAHNLRLSRRRARAVAAYLVGLGLPRGVMTLRARGETLLLVDTPDHVRNDQNRRAEIYFEPLPVPRQAAPVPR